MNGLEPEIITTERAKLLARLGDRHAATPAPPQGGDDPIPPPPDLAGRIAGQMTHDEPTWAEFASANPEAAKVIDRGIGNAYGTDWHKRVMVAWNRDLPAELDAIAAELAERRVEAMGAWLANAEVPNHA